jgi:hypothetical protein
MFAYISLFLAFGAAAINLGWLPLPMGHWPGISLGLAATLAGILELRGKPDRVDLKALAWAGAAIGLLSALVGTAIYLGWGIAAGRMG